LGNNAAVTEPGEKASRRIRPPGARPLAGCRAVIGDERNGYGVQRPGRRLSLTEPWGGVRMTCCEAENPGGQSTPRCGNVEAGRPGRPTRRKKRKHGRLRFFLLPGPRPRAGGCPSPVEPLKDGFTTRVEWSGAERREYPPPIFAFERGKPGGEGEGQYRPPLHCRLTTMGLKVARPWAGLVRWVPHGATHSRGWGECRGFYAPCFVECV
jgi:hypothetical protein